MMGFRLVDMMMGILGVEGGYYSNADFVEDN